VEDSTEIYKWCLAETKGNKVTIGH